MFDVFCCFITAICRFVCLTSCYRDGHNSELLKFTKKTGSDSLNLVWHHFDTSERSKLSMSRSLQWPSIPAEHRKTLGTKNEVNSMRPVRWSNIVTLFVVYMLNNICSHSTMLRPVMLSCGNSSCHECLVKLVATMENPSCPMCRVAFAHDATLISDIAMNTLTRNLEVASTNDDYRWTSTYKRAEDHTKQCPKKKVRCLNEGCQYVLAPFDLRQAIGFMSRLWIAHGKRNAGTPPERNMSLQGNLLSSRLRRDITWVFCYSFGTLISHIGLFFYVKKKRETACKTVTVNEANDWNK